MDLDIPGLGLYCAYGAILVMWAGLEMELRYGVAMLNRV